MHEYTQTMSRDLRIDCHSASVIACLAVSRFPAYSCSTQLHDPLQLNALQSSKHKFDIQGPDLLLSLLRRLCSRNDSIALPDHLRHGSRLQHVLEALPVSCAVERLEALRQLEQGLLHPLCAWRHFPRHQLRVLLKGVVFVWEDSQLPCPLLHSAASSDPTAFLVRDPHRVELTDHSRHDTAATPI